MRITQTAVQGGVQRNLQASLSRLMRLQEQLSSGKAVSRPSDSPTSAVAALRFRSDIRRSEQLTRNADDAVAWLDTTDRSLQAASGLVVRARELVLQGANGSPTPEEREALALEVERLRESALAVANTTYLGRPVFGGTSTAPTAYDGSTGAWLGDTGAVTRSIADEVVVRVDVPGTEAFGPAGSDLFSLLSSVADHLRAGDSTQLSADLTGLDAAAGRVTAALSSVGARTNQVEGLRARVEAAIEESTSGLASVESIDLPATVMQLQLQEVAYQAALSATSRVLQPSLVDFLR